MLGALVLIGQGCHFVAHFQPLKFPQVFVQDRDYVLFARSMYRKFENKLGWSEESPYGYYQAQDCLYWLI